MKKTDIKGLSKEQSEAIFGQIAKLAGETFLNMDLSRDLVKAAQMLLLKDSLSQDPAEITQEFVANTLFPRAVNSVFADYQIYCHRYSLSKTQDPNLSEDIAQEAVKLLLSSPKRVENIGAWLIQVTYNLLRAHYKESKKEKKLYQELSLEAGSYEKWLKSEDLMELKELDSAMVEEMLKSDEYQQYHEIISFDSIKDYAAAHNISEEVAQKRKERARRNLKSMVLLSLGWRDTPSILDYNQYNAIRKFIREVPKVLKGEEEAEWIKSLNSDHIEAVRTIKTIADWGIKTLGERNYRITLFAFLEDRKPLGITFNIVLSKRNSVSVQSCLVNTLAAKLAVDAKVRVPVNRGMSMWTFEEITTLLKKIHIAPLA